MILVSLGFTRGISWPFCSPRFWCVGVRLFYDLVFCSVYWYLVVCVTVGQTNVLMLYRLTRRRYGEVDGDGTTRTCWIAACRCQSSRKRASTSTSSRVWQRAIPSTSRSRTKPLFYQLRSLNVFDTIDRNSLVFMYKEFHNLLPKNLLSYFKKGNDRSLLRYNHDTRKNTLSYKVRYRRNCHVNIWQYWHYVHQYFNVFFYKSTILRWYCCCWNKFNSIQKVTRATQCASEEELREAVRDTSRGSDRVIVATYSRKVFKQTGDGHFSPIGGYHPGRDLVLILDTARFKYPPHWVPLTSLWEAMQAVDKDTGKQ